MPAADAKVTRKKRMSEEEKASEEERRYRRLWRDLGYPEAVRYTIYDTRDDVKFINDLNVLNARDNLEKLNNSLIQGIEDFRALVKKRKADKLSRLSAVEQQREQRKEQRQPKKITKKE